MKNFKTAAQWITLVVGTVVLSVGLLDAGKDAMPIVGAILVGSAVISFAVGRNG